MTKVELRQELNKISMTKGQEPAALFEQISAVENRYNTGTAQVTKEEMIAVILDAASAECQAVLTSEQRSKGDALTSEDLEDAMTQHWRQINKGKRSEDDNELTLSSIVCYECHEEGHKANQCPKRGGHGGGRGGGRGGRGGRGG
jgi:hypothetical protein